MRYTDCLKFAVFDLKYKYKNTFRTVLCFCLLQFIISVWMLISIVLPRTQVSSSKDDSSLKYFASQVKLSESGDVDYNSEGWGLNEYLLSKDYIYSSNPMFSSIDLISFAEKEDRWSFVNTEWLELEISNCGERIAFKADDCDNLRFVLVDCGNQLFYSQNEFDSYAHMYNDYYEKAMIYGSSNIGVREIILPDIVMESFVPDRNLWTELIGMDISVLCEECTLIENYKLIGIYDYRLYYDYTLIDDGFPPSYFDFPVYIRCDSSDRNKYGIEQYDLVMYCKDGVDYAEAFNNIVKAGYVNVFFSDMGLVSAHGDKVLVSAEKITNELVICLGSVISISVLFYLATITYIEEKTKAGFVGVLRALGLENKKLFIVVILQQLIMSIIAVLPAVLSSGVVLAIFNNILYNSVGIVLDVRIDDYAKALLVSVSFTLLAGILFYIPVIISYARKTVSELLCE